MTRRLLLSYLTVTVVVLVLLEVPLAVFYAQRELDRLTPASSTTPRSSPRSTRTTSKPAAPRPAPGADATRPAPAPSRRRRRPRHLRRRHRPARATATSRPVPRSPPPSPASRAIGTRTSETLDTDLLYVAVPVASSGTVHGALRLTLDTADVDAHVHRFWLGLAAIAVVVLAAMASSAG